MYIFIYIIPERMIKLIPPILNYLDYLEMATHRSINTEWYKTHTFKMKPA